MAATNVTGAEFEQVVLSSPIPVLVDYWADWCSPCKQMAPIIDEVADEYEGHIRIVKVDTNVETGLATQYGIMSLPTLQFFVNGEIVKQLQGGKTKSNLIKAIEEVIEG